MLTYLLVAVISLLLHFEQPKPEAQQPELDQPEFVAAKDIRAEIIEFAKNYLGTTYRYASTDPGKGFDCSGFVYFVYKHFDIDMPRSSREYYNLGPALKPEEFKIGDILVFYGFTNNSQIGHVGIIYEANGMNSKFIHATSGKAYSVVISDLGSSMYTRRFHKCIDVIN
jgi:cell wall-associated NlpC family hydrolase